MNRALRILASTAVLLVGACASADRTPAASLSLYFVFGEVPVTGEGLEVTMEVVDSAGQSMGELMHEIPTQTTLMGSATGMANHIRDHYGVTCSLSGGTKGSNDPITLTLEGGYRFGRLTQRRHRGSSTFERGSTLRIRMAGKTQSG